MQTITTTELRTQSPKLVNSLRLGKTVSLIHRSKIIGTISPAEPQPKVFDAKKFLKIIKDLPMVKTSTEEREKAYRKHLEKKYGKYLSRH